MSATYCCILIDLDLSLLNSNAAFLVPVRHDVIYPPNINTYVRLVYVPSQYYDVVNDLSEELLIKFSTTNPNGLLWYTEDGTIKSYIYLQVN